MEETLEGGRGPPRAVAPLERERNYVKIAHTHTHTQTYPRSRSVDCRLCQQLLFTTKCSSFLDFYPLLYYEDEEFEKTKAGEGRALTVLCPQTKVCVSACQHAESTS
jgi:hypothetical protein